MMKKPTEKRFDWNSIRCPKLLVDAKLVIRNSERHQRIHFVISDKRFVDDLIKLESRWPFTIRDITLSNNENGNHKEYHVMVETL